MNPSMLYSSGLSTIRAVDEQSRTATFVAATEGLVDTFMGPEVLRMSGARLERFNRNPVFLDSHAQGDARAVIGSVSLAVQGRELHATVTYASTARAEEIFTLVREGHLRAVSVGFIPNRGAIRRLLANETDGEGEGAVVGPARVVNEWQLIELSQVAIPADENALRRSFYEKEGARMEYPAITPQPAEPKREPSVAPVVREVKVDKPTDLEIQARNAMALTQQREAFRREVLAICPSSLHGFAEGLILTQPSADLNEIRKQLAEEHAKRSQPVGTPEPTQPQATQTPMVSDDVLLRSF